MTSGNELKCHLVIKYSSISTSVVKKELQFAKKMQYIALVRFISGCANKFFSLNDLDTETK